MRNIVKYSRKLWSCTGKIALAALGNQLQCNGALAIFVRDHNDNDDDHHNDEDDNDDSMNGENDKQQYYALHEV